jgi:uncharacterized membrane protein
MFYATLKLAHTLAIIVWIGGMVFAHFFLRPATLALEPPQRVRLMHDTLGRFFNAVAIAVLVILTTGLWMIGRVAKRLSRAVQATDWAAGGLALASIRTWVAVNLSLGVLIVGITLLAY